MKKALKIILGIVLGIVLIVGGYVGYVFGTYSRIEDNLEYEVNNPEEVAEAIPVGVEQKITSWNIGFAAYLQDYSFFMDGGDESRARSKEAVEEDMENIVSTLQEEKSDLYIVQEVDFDATRSHKVDEREYLTDGFKDYANTWIQNYNSAYLFWPLTEPHGANNSSLVSMSKYQMTSSIRRSLPIQTDFAKVLDLDRAYDVIRIPAENGKELVLINLHLSAYTTDPTIADQQLDMLYKQISVEGAKGNYVICGGDYNKDLLGKSGDVFGVSGDDYSWCQPFKEENLPEGFRLIAPYKEGSDRASCRNANEAYNKETTFRCTLDGFIVSDNVEVKDADVIEMDYMYSDHNPVFMKFVLK